MDALVAQDWRDERIAELEAELRARDERICEQDARIAELEQKVAELSERLGQNSQNSHLPPSTDPPHARKRRKDKAKGKGRGKSKRKRGGQPGHRGAKRELLPPEKVNKIVDLYPPHCENCWQPLPQVPGPTPKRYQQTEIPPIQPETTEWRRHTVGCENCGHKTCAAYDGATIPASPFGPRLMAIMALVVGIYHLSRRKAATLLCDLLGVQVSLGALSAVEARVSEAVRPAVEEAWDKVSRAKVKHTDGTSWAQGGAALSLWTIASKAATVFKIVASSAKKTLRPLYGRLHGILVSDRAKALNFWAMERRQICWSHLIRKYVSFSERDGPAGELGRQLLDYAGILFEYWHDYKDGKLSREKLVAWTAPLREQVEAVLQRAVDANIKGVSGSCADILVHKAALWTFLEHEGVPPTNNHAEQEIRAFVMWRKRSFGTQSERGNLFAERLMTVAHTARKQKTDVLAFVTACCQAQLKGAPAPSLFDAGNASAG
jgi:transposase